MRVFTYVMPIMQRLFDSSQIDSVSERDEGFYFCAAVSSAGSVIHRVHLKVRMCANFP